MHRHGVDDHRPLRSVHHHYFEQVSGPVGTEEEVAGRVRGDLLNDHGVAYGVLGVGQVDAVAERRPESIHRGIVLRNRLHADRLAAWEVEEETGEQQSRARLL